MNKYYRRHRIIDGKWEVIFWIKEDEHYVFNPSEPPNLRILIEANYDKEPIEMAKEILNSVLHCERVQINTLQGAGIYVEK